MSWSLKLPKSIKLKDGRVLRTLRDAHNLLRNLTERRQHVAWNQHAAGLLLEAAKSEKPVDIEAATFPARTQAGGHALRRTSKMPPFRLGTIQETMFGPWRKHGYGFTILDMRGCLLACVSYACEDAAKGGRSALAEKLEAATDFTTYEM